MRDMERQIKKRIDAFIRDLSELARKAAESKLAKAQQGKAGKAKAGKGKKGGNGAGAAPRKSARRGKTPAKEPPS